MQSHKFLSFGSILLAAAVAGWACNSDSVGAPSHGNIRLKMTDAPFPADSVDSVNVFVTRVDIRASDTDSAGADSAIASDSAAAHGWITIATPNRMINLLALRNGVTTELGTAPLAAGHYSGMRLVIDPSRSRVVVKGGLVLTGTTSPNVTFPSGSSSGIKIKLAGGLDVVAGATTDVLLDFDLDQSFVMRGNSITQLGLLFKPVIKATVGQ